VLAFYCLVEPPEKLYFGSPLPEKFSLGDLPHWVAKGRSTKDQYGLPTFLQPDTWLRPRRHFHHLAF